MAGKTLTGIGDIEDESGPLDAADAADSHPYYSGPTVVDDVKVEAGLQKLRSLESPVTLTGITQAAVEALDLDPDAARPTPPLPFDSTVLTGEAGSDAQRETAVGHSVNGPFPGQPPPITPFDDRALRGTMFGHSIHLPEINLPVPEEPPPRGAQPFVARGKETSAEVLSDPDADGPSLEDAQLPLRTPRPDRYGGQTIDISQLQPQRPKVGLKLALGAVGLLAVAVAAIIWMRTSDAYQPEARSAPPAASTPPAPAPATAAAKIDSPAPGAVPGVAVGGAMPAEAPAADPHHPAAAAPAEDGLPVPARSHGTIDPPTTAGDDAPAVPAHEHHPRGGSSRSEHHHGGTGHASDSAGDGNSPAKPAPRPRRVDEDPDGTMAPSIE